MHMHRAGELAALHALTILEHVTRVSSLRLHAVSVHAKHIEHALPLERHIHPRLAGMKVEVPRAEAVAAVRRDHRGNRKQAIVKTKQPQRARILRLTLVRAVAAVDQYRHAVGWRHHYLMRIDPIVEVFGLLYFATDSSINSAISAVMRSAP